jgi:hypothetical protein
MLPACMRASQRKALSKLHETANTVQRHDFWPLDGIRAYFQPHRHRNRLDERHCLIAALKIEVTDVSAPWFANLASCALGLSTWDGETLGTGEE